MKFRKKPVVIEAITFDELVEYGKANPAKSNYATSSPAFTVASELGPSYWVEPSIHTRFVGELINVMPAGTVPFQPGPAMRMLPPPVPVVRFPGAARTFVHADRMVIWL